MMRLPSLLLSALALGFAGVVIVPSIASAQDASMQEAFDSSRFRPSSVGSGGILVDGVVPGAPWELDGSLWFQAARRPLMYTVDGVVTDPVVSGRIGGFLSVGFTFGRWARLALDLPVTLYQQGENPQTGEALPTGGPGDLRLSPHVQILDPRKAWLGLAISSPVSFPTGKVEALLGDGQPTVHPQLHLEKRLAWPKAPLLRFAVNLQAGYLVRPRTEVLDLDTAGQFTIGAGLRWEPLDRLGVGTEIEAGLGDGANGRSAEWLTWVRVRPDRDQRIDVLGGLALGIGQGVGTPQARFILGVRARLDPRPKRAVVTVVEAEPPPVDQRGLGEQPPIPGAEDHLHWGLRLVDRRIVIDSRVLFDFDKSKLRPEAGPVLESVARWYLGHGLLHPLEVAGHCDNRGSHAYNDRLSVARAEAVRVFLAELGVPEGRLKAVGHGKRRPRKRAGSAKAEEVHQANRRVEFTILREPSGRSTAKAAPGTEAEEGEGNAAPAEGEEPEGEGTEGAAEDAEARAPEASLEAAAGA